MVVVVVVVVVVTGGGTGGVLAAGCACGFVASRLTFTTRVGVERRPIAMTLTWWPPTSTRTVIFIRRCPLTRMFRRLLAPTHTVIRLRACGLLPTRTVME